MSNLEPECPQIAPYDNNSREEEAERSLKRTKLSRSLAWFLVGTFLIIILSEPILQSYFEKHSKSVAHPHIAEVVSLLPSLARADKLSATRQEPLRGFWRYWEGLPTIKEIQEFEKGLERQSRVGQVLLPVVQNIMTGHFGAGNEQAYVGRDGWLFYRPEVDYVTGPGFLESKVLKSRAHAGDASTEAVQPDPIKAIVAFKEQLAERGIELIVMPAPVKSVIEGSHLSSAAMQGLIQNPSYARFIEEMTRNHVTVFDPSKEFAEAATKGPAYLETDTHWLPQTMDLAARSLADLIRSKGWISSLAALQLASTDLRITNLGDIAEMLKLSRSQKLLRPELVTIHQVRAPGGGLWAPDRSSDVLLLGDSFFNIYSLAGMRWGESAGFAERLSYHLQHPLDKIVINAGGSFASRQELAKDILRSQKKGEPDRLVGKRLVVYEFAMRDLSVGDWKIIDLPKAVAAVTSLPKDPKASSEDLLIVKGIIGSITSPPKPGTVPYKDCVIALHLKEIAVMGEGQPQKEALVFLWGMKDNAWTPAASFKVGQQITLKFFPWGKVEPQYSGYNRIELNEPGIDDLDLFWAELQ